ncbi:MAG: CinA family protein [Alphaproteobacteria bacterium]|nr:CinA family protein [Alphaproteobacteria bacterium]
MFPPEHYDLARQVIDLYTSHKRKIVTAESCTGGLIAAALTEIPGASAVLERGFVSYSNDAKVEVLGVMPELLELSGAVSPDVAEAMAQGALEFSLAHTCLSVTGIAGPDGGSALKPVGLVYFGFARRGGSLLHYRCQFAGDRGAIRMQAVREGLRLLLSMGQD